jgi:[ribosomal protein S18]-alanine N-acetyltransferase
MRYLPGLVPSLRLPGSRGPAIVAAVLRSVPSIGAARSIERIRRGWQMQFEVVGPHHADILADLLPRIDQTYFRPHPMTAEGAARIVGLRGRDIYLLGIVQGEAIAYGMLRGWDEGYPIPSLGIGVRKDALRMGYGRAMMLALHEAARASGASTVRLRVDPENVAALSLYRSLGYRHAGIERGEDLMLLDL